MTKQTTKKTTAKRNTKSNKGEITMATKKTSTKTRASKQTKTPSEFNKMLDQAPNPKAVAKKATVKSTPKKKSAAKKPVAKKEVSVTGRMVLTVDQKVELIETFTADKAADIKFKDAHAQLVEAKKEFASFPVANLAAYYYAAGKRITVKKVKGEKQLVQ